MTTNRKRHLIRTVTNFIDVTTEVSLNLSNIGELSGVQCKRTVYKKKKNENLFTDSIRRAHAVRKFPDAAAQRRLRNVQKSAMHVQSCCFVNVNLLLFSFLNCCRPRRRCLSSPLFLIQKFCYHGTVTSPLSSLFDNAQPQNGY